MISNFVTAHPGVYGLAFAVIVGGGSAWALLVGHNRHRQRVRAWRGLQREIERHEAKYRGLI